MNAVTCEEVVVPDRIIRERALTSPSLDRLSDGAERLFWRLVPVADDYGRFDANPAVVRSRSFPLRTDKRLRVSIVKLWLGELIGVDAIRLYSVAGRQYGYFPSWFESQRHRDSKPKYPSPPEGEPSEPLEGIICAEDAQVSASPPLAATRGHSPLLPYAVRPKAESREPRGVLGGEPPPIAAAPAPVEFKIAAPLLAALDKSPILGACPALRRATWWQAEVRANRGVDFEREIYKAEAWITTQARGKYRDLAKFFHGWLGRAERPE